jgi:hypothetical protein
MTTFAEFRDAVMQRAFPQGEPENLRDQYSEDGKLTQRGSHSKDLIGFLIHLQTFSEFYRRHSTNVHPFCSTYFWCGMTIIEAPRGLVHRVYTLPSNSDCCPVHYQYVHDFDLFTGWVMATRPSWTDPENTGLPTLPAIGLRFSEASTDKGVRFSYGYWTRREGRIYIGHRIESSERIIVEWEGVKRDWKDADFVPVTGWHENEQDDASELEYLGALWVLARHRSMVDDDAAKSAAFKRAEFDREFADHLYRIKRDAATVDKGSFSYVPQVQVNGPCAANECAAVTTTADRTLFAILGDTQNDPANGNAEAVATLIDSWAPEFIVTVGDNWYGSAITTADLDSNIGTLYRKYLYPYRGTQGDPVSTRQNFYAATGNHDRDPVGRQDIERDYFNLPPSFPNVLEPCRGYYDFVRGPVHFFLLDGGYDNSNVNRQADGVDAASAQAEWFYARAKASKARWKVAIIHQQPYTSQTSRTPGYTALRWPFKDYVDLVVSGHGHLYERLEVAGLPYIVNGLGGATKTTFGDALPESLVRYDATHGAMKVEADCTTFKSEFIATDGTVIDTLELTKA